MAVFEDEIKEMLRESSTSTRQVYVDAPT